MASVKNKESNTPSPDPDKDFIARSSLYQEFLAERKAILNFKDKQSNEKGHKLTFDEALIGWVQTEQDTWRANRRPKSK